MINEDEPPQGVTSRPVWGAWIEISYLDQIVQHLASRAPYGARGLKFHDSDITADGDTVAPRMGRVD